ncbi:apoptosis-inducing factor mitochondrial-like [Plasmopara halstedii]|uniref:Apoptosis-inducing factor mitochondrial-like n=1 Tax=Plasmopara halstedii TaxID=4781 RepID=A0A0P1A6R3_PLAHL|nr:apoptosis-inducing factor mitochondrial-like [Plasmopara halstedii]CEG35866.1 apoptosis-inducing factor mitochondrial-like [Plasmopara halstedii]|eukprot:XP_024572235.1 apoptosis-inducing factor mitochondrial-like [Plasmopara halstedii]
MWRSLQRSPLPAAALTAGLFSIVKSSLNEPVQSTNVIPLEIPAALSSPSAPSPGGDKLRLSRRFTRRKQTKHHRYVIVGSGTAANAAIEAIRQEDACADILVLSDENALPRLDFGVQQPRGDEDDSDGDDGPSLAPALLISYNEWRRHLSARFEEDVVSSTGPPPLTLLLDKRPLEFDVEKNRVLLGDGTEVRYERCLVASAGRPRHFYVLDSDRVSYALKDRVNTCTTHADFVRLDQLAAGASDEGGGAAQSVLVIGAGFLGCEVACALATDPRNNHLKIKLVFVEQLPAARTLPPYLAEELARRLSHAGVDVVSNRLVTSLRPSLDDDDNESDRGVTVGVLGKDKPEVALDADYVVLASTHTDPATTLRMGRATRTGGGLERDEKNGGLVVNAQLEAVSGLFVAGNAASYYDPYLGRRRVDRYDHAVNSGLTAGRNMVRSLRGAGKMKTYRHQPLFRSHLPGIGVLMEGIGEVNSSSRTVGVWVQPPNLNSSPNGSQGTPYERGVVYFLKGNKIMGIVLWNASDVLESARQLMLSRPEIRDNVEEELKHAISLAPNDWLHVVST